MKLLETLETLKVRNRTNRRTRCSKGTNKRELEDVTKDFTLSNFEDSGTANVLCSFVEGETFKTTKRGRKKETQGAYQINGLNSRATTDWCVLYN